MNPILDFFGSIIKPVGDIVDSLHTSDEERLTLKQKMFELQVSLYSKVLDYEARLVEAQSKIITSEAQSDSWLTKNWRPLTMVTFVGLVVARWVGFTAPGISETVEMELWSIIKIGIGGYVAGRSVEKVVPAIADAIGNLKAKE